MNIEELICESAKEILKIKIFEEDISWVATNNIFSIKIDLWLGFDRYNLDNILDLKPKQLNEKLDLMKKDLCKKKLFADVIELNLRREPQKFYRR